MGNYDFTKRTELVMGKENIEKLSEKRVAVFGIGGVGGHAAEALARAGIGKLDIIDSDTIELSNINRQMVALHSTVGRLKTDVMKERILDINPMACVRTYPVLYLPETADFFDFREYDYVLDAVDNMTAKIDLVMRAKEAKVPIICAMGAGNKLYPELFEVSDLFKTSVDPLAKRMRKELKTRGVTKLNVVYSREAPVFLSGEGEETTRGNREESHEKLRKTSVGSVSWVPGVMGMLMAGKVIRDLTGIEEI